MTDIGLARGTVELMAHQTSWHELFKYEAALIKTALGDVPIEHVGSTAIPDLLAKPIIDMALCYDVKRTADSWIEPLSKLGYEYKGEEGVPNRLFFVKGPEGQRLFYLHVVDDIEFKRLTDFRDKLKGSSQLVREYSDLKAALAKSYPDDRRAYTHGKDEFIKIVLSG